MRATFTPSETKRFWEKVNVRGDGDCWEWTAARNRGGYGRFLVDGINRLAARVVYAMTHGNLPEGLCVLHSCDNPPCVNPKHLWLGTREDNNHDCINKGRARIGLAFLDKKGEKAACAKLTNEKATEIRRRYSAGGISQTKLAEQFGIKQSTLWSIVTGRTWRHLL